MTDPLSRDDDSLRRRKQLAIGVALPVTGVIFAPLLWALYQDGSIFFFGLCALLWLGVGRFIYHLLAPDEKGRHMAARDENQ